MIRVDGVHLGFGRKQVLRGIDLHVPRGTLQVVIGPAASGKSVLLKVMAGLLRPASGSVEVAGARLDRMDEDALAEARKSIGMLFQNYALFDFMTVGENIAFPLRRLFAPPEEEVRQRVAERLARMQLPGFEERMPSELSGGQKKRIGIARATITRPPVLLFDDPTAGLDPVTTRKIFDLILEEQRAQGATAVVVSSDVERVLTIADRVLMLHEGRVVFQGSAQQARDTDDPLVRQFVHGLEEGPL